MPYLPVPVFTCQIFILLTVKSFIKMAKNSFVRTLALTSNETTVDIPCKQCQRKSKTTEGVKICVNCDEYLCANCAARHSNATKTKNHKIKNREKTLARGLRLPNVSFEERCSFHMENFIDSYCKDHDRTGCYICMSSEHK